MSNENIKTGLRLSEAVKLIEDNPGALLNCEQMDYEFRANIRDTFLSITSTYSVKLPPPKSVQVTKQMINDAWENHVYGINWEVLGFEAFCKELGL